MKTAKKNRCTYQIKKNLFQWEEHRPHLDYYCDLPFGECYLRYDEGFGFFRCTFNGKPLKGELVTSDSAKSAFEEWYLKELDRALIRSKTHG